MKKRVVLMILVLSLLSIGVSYALPSIVGEWVGTVQANNSPTGLNAYFVFNQDGKFKKFVETEDGEVIIGQKRFKEELGTFSASGITLLLKFNNGVRLETLMSFIGNNDVSISYSDSQYNRIKFILSRDTNWKTVRNLKVNYVGYWKATTVFESGYSGKSQSLQLYFDFQASGEFSIYVETPNSLVALGEIQIEDKPFTKLSGRYELLNQMDIWIKGETIKSKEGDISLEEDFGLPKTIVLYSPYKAQEGEISIKKLPLYIKSKNSGQYRIKDSPGSYYPLITLTRINNIDIKPIQAAPVASFILVPGGTFVMGSPENEPGRSKGEVQHQVTLSSFAISNLDVTFDEYDAYCLATGARKPNDWQFGRGSQPVIDVSWYEAVEYCNWRSQQEGRSPAYTISGTDVNCDWSANGYRLPTEAEWEYAAKGGPLANSLAFDSVYAGSANLDQVAWHSGNSGNMPHPVGLKAPNSLGLYDMSGNVLQWCWDWAGGYSTESQIDPIGASSGEKRIIRGSCYFDDKASYARSSSRSILVPSKQSVGVSFRLAYRP